MCFKPLFFKKIIIKKNVLFLSFLKNKLNMKEERKKKLPNKKVINSVKFEAKEQFTKSALENLKNQNKKIIDSLKESGEVK